jgi:hypothetical protein
MTIPPHDASRSRAATRAAPPRRASAARSAPADSSPGVLQTPNGTPPDGRLAPQVGGEIDLPGRESDPRCGGQDRGTARRQRQPGTGGISAPWPPS